jgi:hypothetical protein
MVFGSYILLGKNVPAVLRFVQECHPSPKSFKIWIYILSASIEV